MSKSESSSGAPSASGGSTENPKDNLELDSAKSDTVAYSTHEKLLREKKKRDEELSEVKKQLDHLLTERKSAEEATLKEKEDYKKLLEIREKELEATRNEHSSLKQTLQNGTKMRAFLDSVNGQVAEQYWSLVDLEQIVTDPQTGLPDESSVQKYARDFEKRFPLVLQTTPNVRIPNDAPMPGKALTYEEWQKLPTKEMKARMKDVIGK